MQQSIWYQESTGYFADVNEEAVCYRIACRIAYGLAPARELLHKIV